MEAFAQRYGWLLFALACLLLGYMLIWERGQYTDDYTQKYAAMDALTGQWRPYIVRSLDRALGSVIMYNATGLLVQHELLVRSVTALVTGIDALLLGWLVYRLVPSRLMAVITSWLYVMPVYAFQAVLWPAAINYAFAALFVLLFLHASLCALLRPRQTILWSIVAILFFVAAVSSIEQAAISVVLVPCMALAPRVRQQVEGYRRILAQTIVIVMVSLLIAFGLLVFGYRSANIVVSRGGIDLNPVTVMQRTQDFVTQLGRTTVQHEPGLRKTRQVFVLGAQAILDSAGGTLMLLLAGGLLALTIVFWPMGEERDSGHLVLAILAIGVVWFFLAMLVPGIFIKQQGLVPRLLYLPLAAASVCAGALGWMVSGRFHRPIGAKLVLAAAGGILLVSTVCMVGYERAFQARYQLDQNQLSTLVRSLPSAYLPPDSYVIPLDRDELLFGRRDGLSQAFLGVFQTSWSTLVGLHDAYRRMDIKTAGVDAWTAPALEYEVAQGSAPAQLRVAGIPVPLDKTVFFAYRDHASRVIESLTIIAQDGSQQVVRFPIAEALRAAGIPTIANVTVPAQ